MNLLFEGLVTALLSLDYINQEASTSSSLSSSPTDIIAAGSVPLTSKSCNFHHRHNLWQSSSEFLPTTSRSSSTTSLSSSLGEEHETGSTTTSSFTSDIVNVSIMTGQVESDATAGSSTEAVTIPSPTYQYHCPPPSYYCEAKNENNDETTTTMDSNGDGDYYDGNDTVFGSILRGELPATTLLESSALLAIEDIKPRAPLHGLIIPKAFVGSVFDIGGGSGDDNNNDDNDLIWMKEIQQMAIEVVRKYQPQAYANNDYRLVFHIPPFNSVNHLHLHVLAPLSEMKWYYRYIKYAPQTRWCIELDTILQRLQDSKEATSYRRPLGSRPQKQQPIIILREKEGQSQQSQQEEEDNAEQEELKTHPKETCTNDADGEDAVEAISSSSSPS